MNQTMLRPFFAAAAVGLLMVPAAPGRAADLPPAQDAFVGAAHGRALRLSLGDQTHTLGFSQTQVLSTAAAMAEGAGQLGADATRSFVEVANPGESLRDPQDGRNCASSLLDLPETLTSIVDVGVACSTALGSVTGTMPKANSTGSVASIDIGANELLGQLIAPIQGSLETVFGQLPAELDPATDTVRDLLTSLGSTQTLAARIGDSASISETTARSLTAVATADAAQIDLLPNSAAFGDFLARIEVGSAEARAVHDRRDGASSADVDPALVRVRLAPLAGRPAEEIELAPDQSHTLLAGTPLETDIIVASGRSVERPDGSVVAVADGVSVVALKGLPTGPLTFELAHAEAAVAGTPLIVTKVADPPSVRVGQRFTTTISVTNPHECPLQNVSVEDVLTVEEDSLFRVESTSPAAVRVPSGERLSSGTILWSDIGTIAPGETRSVDVTLLAQGEEGQIVDVATATGTFGACPAVQTEGAEVVAAALTNVPASAVARLESNVSYVLPRTGAGIAGQLGGLGLMLAGFLLSRRRG